MARDIDYNFDEVFDDYAGPLLNQLNVRPGKATMDADRLFLADLIPGVRQQLQFASQEATPALLNLVRKRLLQMQQGNVQGQTRNLQDRAIGSSRAAADSARRRAQVGGANDAVSSALADDIESRGVLAANQALLSEPQRIRENDAMMADLLNQMMNPASLNALNPIANRSFQERNASKNRQMASGDGGIGDWAGLAGGLIGAAGQVGGFKKLF